MKGSLRWVIQFSNSPQPMVGEKLAIIERSKMQLIVDGDKGKPFKRFLSEFMVLQSVVYMEKNDTNDWVQILSSYSPVHTWTASMQSWGDCRIITSRKYKKIVAATLILTLGGGECFRHCRWSEKRFDWSTLRPLHFKSFQDPLVYWIFLLLNLNTENSYWSGTDTSF